ncbi:hypothetical protein AXH35_09985 [Acidipropionibacterium acidipropionici]|uniref:Uncharacterized protein n=1 Tax=Acidipropionibacterium acidipropionici TaxID=1748 RepID=A0AAC8YFG2_9ACTN|nr:hypothetical protein AXH35_09985 [Acidipropionibacterium acidipropionici]AOZ47191.1 hypothetical protein A8L58_11425 [Acidipropionibacterium acidipropionici]
MVISTRALGTPVLVAVGGDHALVDAPGDLDLDVGVVGEQGVQSVLLLVVEQVGAGGQGPAGGIERVALAAAVPTDGLLNSPSALIERLASEARDVEGI